MKQDVYEFKEGFKEKLLSYGQLKRAGSAIQYRMKDCPKCGDMKWHCYLKIDSSSDEPILFHCFKCNSSGIVDQKFIEEIGILNLEVPKFVGGRKLNIGETATTKLPSINVTDMDNIEGVCNYIESRVGVRPTLTDLQFFQYIGNPRKYVTDYLGIDHIDTIRNRYWFQMTNGNIIGRWKNDNNDMRWLKYKTNRCRQAGLYRISVPVDLYQDINVIITEGVMDAIGLYYNYQGCQNNIYVSVMSSNYNKGIQYAIDRGIFGDSVSIKIFKDSDVPTEKIWIDNNMRKLFKRIDIYENLSAKDYGVTPDMLDVHKIIDRRR